jgi:hypothetical protein
MQTLPPEILDMIVIKRFSILNAMAIIASLPQDSISRSTGNNRTMSAHGVIVTLSIGFKDDCGYRMFSFLEGQFNSTFATTAEWDGVSILCAVREFGRLWKKTGAL